MDSPKPKKDKSKLSRDEQIRIVALNASVEFLKNTELDYSIAQSTAVAFEHYIRTGEEMK